MTMGYLRRRYPVDRRRLNPKQLRFDIDDPLLRCRNAPDWHSLEDLYALNQGV